MGRLTGAALLIGCGVWCGLRAAGALAGRVRDLEAWIAALRLLEGELVFSLPNLPELLESLSRRASSPAGETFGAALRGLDRLGELSFEEIWSGAVRSAPGRLSPHDQETLCRLGNILGRYGWEEQREALRALRHELEEERANARAEWRSKGRTHAALGFAVGTFLTILLL